MVCGVLVSCAAWAATSCTQDALDGQLPDPNAPMTFGVGVPDTWVDGTPVRPARAETIVVDELACPDGMQPLYLVTEVSEPVVSATNAENQQIAKQTPSFTPKNVKSVFLFYLR